MEITVYSPAQGQPLPPVEWNFPEVKKWLQDGLARYEGVVYDENQMAEAKRDRANLRKLSDAIDAKRREMKQLYLQPYTEFETQAKELTGMIAERVQHIDAQVKAVEAFKKKEKRERIEAELYAPMIGNLAEIVPYDRLHENRWLNVTCSMGTVGDELGAKIDRIIGGLSSIDKLDMADDLKEHARDVFLKTFDLAAALSDLDRIKKQREAVARCIPSEMRQNAPQSNLTADHAETPPPSPKRSESEMNGDREADGVHVVEFRVRATAKQLRALRAAMDEIGIKPERI